jgi:hypothetical protein
MVIAGLKELDPIAYIRYAIVYLGLDNLTSVRDMLNILLADQNAGAKTEKPAAGASASPAVNGEPGTAEPEQASS